MNLWNEIPSRAAKNVFNVVIEISKGSKVKYEIDKNMNFIRVDRLIYSSMHYPTNYGFIPQTLENDGDALDILVFAQEPFIPLSVCRARAISCLEVIDQGKVDNKIIAVCADDPEFDRVREIADLSSHKTIEIKNFFEYYKKLEKKVVEVRNFSDSDQAIKIIEAAEKMYKDQK